MKKKLLLALLSFALLVILNVLNPLINIPRVQAASSWPVYQKGDSGENVASIQYMLRSQKYQLEADGQYGSTTTKTVAHLQNTYRLKADGIVGPNTWEKLIVTTQMGSSGNAVVALQRQLNTHGYHLVTDGKFGKATLSALKDYQGKNGLQTDGIAGLLTWNKLVNSKGADVIVGDVTTASTNVPCAAGTKDMGIHDGYHKGTLVKIRLCAIPNLLSTSEESQLGSAYYISGADGKGLVNSRVSGAVLSMVSSAKNAGINISAKSTFRSMAHQRALCATDPPCRSGNYTYVAKPGYSSHQMGLAIDFAGTNVKGGATCSTRATDRNNALWKWLYGNASRFGYKQYSAESWHWDPLALSNRC